MLSSGYEPDGYESGDDWIDALPGLIRDLLAEWELEPIGRSSSGVCAVAIPVRLLGTGRDLVGVSGEGVLKITWPHPEAATEHLALQTWNGHGAVRLVRADPARFALLLERLHTRDLTRVDIDEACGVIGDLLARLRPARPPARAQPHGIRPRQAEELRAAPAVLPRRYLDQAAAARPRARRAGAGRGPAAAHRPALHQRARRLPLPLARHRPQADGRRPWRSRWLRPCGTGPTSSGTGSEVRWSLRRRLEIICERAGLDEGRARAWTIVREADNALDAAEALAKGPADDAWAHDRISLAVTIIKAMND